MQKSSKRVKTSFSTEFKLSRSDKRHRFVVTEDGHLYVSGINLSGELGVGDPEARDNLSPVKGLDDRKVINLWNFETVTFVCTEDGGLYVSGYNKGGQLGVGDYENRFLFTPVVGFEGSFVVDILQEEFFLMWDTFFILTQQGKLYWKLRHGVTFTPAFETEVKIKWITKSGFGSVFACTAAGKLYACGQNIHGCLGVGDFELRDSFVEVKGIPSMHAINQLVFGGYKSAYALTREGFLFTWGKNREGQLGHGDKVDYYIPKEVTTTYKCDYKAIARGQHQIKIFHHPPFKGRFKSIKAYLGSVYAISREGELFVCGQNDNGQLGLGDKVHRTKFEKVKDIDRTVIDVILGQNRVKVMTVQDEIFQYDRDTCRFIKSSNQQDLIFPVRF